MLGLPHCTQVATTSGSLTGRVEYHGVVPHQVQILTEGSQRVVEAFADPLLDGIQIHRASNGLPGARKGEG